MKTAIQVSLRLLIGWAIVAHIDRPALQTSSAICAADEKPPGQAKADAVRATPQEILARPVSLNVKGIPLRNVLAEVARSANAPLKLDEPALVAAKLDLDAPITLTLTDEALQAVLLRLIDFRRTGVFWEWHHGEILVTTFPARNERIVNVLPEWMKPHFNQGLLVDLDQDDRIVSVTTGNIMTDELLERLQSLPDLRQLTIGSSTKITSAGLAHLAAMRRLELVSFSSLENDKEELGDVVLQHLAGLKSLTNVHMEECGVTDAGIRYLEGMPRLTHLSLRDGRITDGAMASIARMLQLKSLDLRLSQSAKYGRMEFSAVALRQLSVLQNLEVLRLTSQSCDGQFLPLALLTVLDISGPLLDDTSAEGISQCRALKSLSISNTHITDNGWKRIGTLPDLTDLRIHRERITDDGFVALKGLKRLQHLEMRTPNLTDATLRHLAEIKSLSRLDLWGSGQTFGGGGSRFTVEGLQQLQHLPNLRTLWLFNLEDPAGYLGLKELTQLQELVFEMAGISQEQYNELEAALPQTQVTAGTGAGHRKSIRRPNW